MQNNLARIVPVAEFLKVMDLDLSRLHAEPQTGTGLEYEVPIRASKFIKFAELDLQENTAHGVVNALSNAKRAIDCQADTVLGSLGLLSRRNFPQKMNILREIGLVAPRIVAKVITARNYLEHEYREPEREQVEDAVDVAALFVSMLELAMQNVWYDFLVQEQPVERDEAMEALVKLYGKWITVSYDAKQPQYWLEGRISEKAPSGSWEVVRSVVSVIKPGDRGYMSLARLSFNFSLTDPDEEGLGSAFVQLFRELASLGVGL